MPPSSIIQLLRKGILHILKFYLTFKFVNFTIPALYSTLPNLKRYMISPFLRWAGSKRWLVKNHASIFPQSFKKYIEPFVGGGSVFFKIKPTNAILSDINEELIITYVAIKEDWNKVYNKLKEHHLKHNEEYYYKIRKSQPKSNTSRAARFIYLNRTCWNGLYRVNKSGKFNVPIGTKTEVLLKTDNFEKISKLLKYTELINGDFINVINLAQKDDFLFVDPPYTVKHNNNGFLQYNETLFSWKDQERLRDCLIHARERGAIIVVTNANHESIKELYKNFKFYTIKRTSILAADPAFRGEFEELIIKG